MLIQFGLTIAGGEDGARSWRILRCEHCRGDCGTCRADDGRDGDARNSALVFAQVVGDPAHLIESWLVCRRRRPKRDRNSVRGRDERTGEAGETDLVKDLFAARTPHGKIECGCFN